MHQAAREYVSQWASDEPLSVVEIGGRDVNGGIRDLWPHAFWTSLDLEDGPGVDIVADALDWTPPDPVDVVICCEVLEHCPQWPGLIAQAFCWLRPGGVLLVTCAGPGREPHSAHDGGPLRNNEFYCNIHSWILLDAAAAAGFEILQLGYRGDRCDTQMAAERPT